MKLVKKNNQNPDFQLIESIKERIKWDSRLSNSDVFIKVKEGKVEISGVFDSTSRKKAILSILKTTRGVVKFTDFTQVAPNKRRSDKDIQRLLIKQIAEFYLFDGEWIDITVANGTVLLEGLVYRKNLKAFSSRITWELSGVQDCINQIKIKRPPASKSGAVYLSLPKAA